MLTSGTSTPAPRSPWPTLLPSYLTEAVGLVDKAPPEFGADIDQGRDVPDAVLAGTLAVIDTDRVVALIFNG